MLCLRVFIAFTVYIVYMCVFIEEQMYTKFADCCISELHAHLCAAPIVAGGSLHTLLNP